MTAVARKTTLSNRTKYLDRTADCTPRAEPFRGAEEAWFWTVAALSARRDGTRSSAPRTARPCEPDDVIRALDQLYRQRRIDLLHARILRIWGERQAVPNPAYQAEACDARIWQEAMARLEWKLRMKGIVGAIT